MAYLTADLDRIIGQLEAALSKGYASVTHEGNTLVYRSVKDIREAIVYFQALYDEVADAPSAMKRKIRTFYMYGGDI